AGRPAARHLMRHVAAVLAVGLAVGEPPEPPDHPAHAPGGEGGDGRAGRRLVERTELVGKTRHGAPDAHAACPHAPTHVIDGTALHDVAVDNRAPAADLHEALWVAVAFAEDALFVEPGPRAAMMDRCAKEPSGPAELVERRQRPQALQEEEHGEHRLGEVVPLWRTPRDVDHGQTEGAPVILAEEVHETHGAGGIALSRGDT